MLSLVPLFPVPAAPLALLLPRLEPKQCFHFQARAGERLVAQSTVWLTQEGCLGDVVLAQGQGWQVETDGLIVVQGLAL